ncbi:u-box domain-containing protein [Colletotrichum truncatum]|uniref:U-box domain-containing protein n=1 Tax=Colletotrichum truncatum TaxID=5467 RepID=A0ACC3YRJ2_COLTU|nr:u-box domain-containing protein [Colletotrichum truncatum]KAF6784225.1 u-box domain-containing protein [Colletotrichum truncatum]
MVRKWLFGSFSEAPAPKVDPSLSDVTVWTTTSTTGPDTDVTSTPNDDVALSIHPLPTKDGLIAKITPPAAPAKFIAHVPCDIVLVIDVSGSMGCNAPVPAKSGERPEDYGLSVLDLVKHAARTIIETMDEGDRLGIVTFASRAKVLQKLTPMTGKNKRLAEKNIKSMRPIDSTNLWHGILEGIKVFNEGGEVNTGRVPAIMVLTDGLPNYMCPIQGYVPKLRAMEQLPASIHTFGFGYSLRSGLLKSIAEIGGGNYAFIPDAGMIGTVFVHAMANLQATYAVNATLRLTYPAVLDLEETTGDSVVKQEVITLPDEEGEPKQLSISLGNLQYGQSRDIYLRVKAPKDLAPECSNIIASVEYSRMTSALYRKTTEQSLQNPTTLPETEIAYHISRSQICSFLSSIIPLKENGEHEALEEIPPPKLKELETLITTIPAQMFPDEPKNNSLLQDLSGAEPKGQISLALTKPDYYVKWGVHYLPSLLNAHTRQICNTFKDAGPLQYGVDSAMFIACRNKLDDAFDTLPPPKPSNGATATHRGNFSMSSYNNGAGVCFIASTPVCLASGREVPIKSLRRGVAVQTPSGPRRVVAVLKTPVRREIMCRVGELVVTPWHPISADGGKSWVFPANVARRPVRYTGCIYSVLLQPDQNSNAHAIKVAGVWGVTLGHGLTIGQDVRAHHFFGHYGRVVSSLRSIGVRRSGIAVGGGVSRDTRTGLVRGFRPAQKVMMHRGKQAAGKPV